MDKEAYGASGFEHGTVAGVLWQKGALGFAARSQANSGPERVGKEPYFHLRSIAPSENTHSNSPFGAVRIVLPGHVRCARSSAWRCACNFSWGPKPGAWGKVDTG